MASVLVVWYLMKYAPYSDPADAKVELLNELWLMVATETFFLYTDYTPLKYRFKYGYVYASLLVFGWLANIGYYLVTRIK